MKYITTAAAMLATTTTLASAGGIDRSTQFLGPLFERGGESGSYAQLSFGRISPDAQASNLGVSSSLTDYSSIGLAYKTDFNEKLSFALIVEEPYGADIRYALATPFAGGGASVSSEQITGVLRYKFNENWSVHGGIRALQVDGLIDTFVAAPVPGGVAPISVTADGDFAFGGLVGVAYERPDIALRVALTYNSAIDVDFSGTETVFGDVGRSIVAATGGTDFTVEFPESINLEFQTGIAEDTLLFGSIRHAFYDGFNLTAPANPAIFGGALGPTRYVNFADDTTTFTLGVGRRFNENWSGTVSITHEDEGVVPSTTALAPTTGFTSLALGVRYTQDAWNVSGGVSYANLGNQLVNSPVGQANFDDNDLFGFGIRLGYNF